MHQALYSSSLSPSLLFSTPHSIVHPPSIVLPSLPSPFNLLSSLALPCPSFPLLPCLPSLSSPPSLIFPQLQIILSRKQSESALFISPSIKKTPSTLSGIKVHDPSTESRSKIHRWNRGLRSLLRIALLV